MIEGDGITGEKAPHDSGDGSGACSQKEMIRNERPGETGCGSIEQNLAEPSQEIITTHIVPDRRFLSIPRQIICCTAPAHLCELSRRAIIVTSARLQVTYNIMDVPLMPGRFSDARVRADRFRDAADQRVAPDRHPGQRRPAGRRALHQRPGCRAGSGVCR